ncbi:MAG: hypothetical protein A2X94_02325 [Bdellovibrionales bacterium GWB1_55_8]|nr:MAG: hypothetical protein A2X94_02325 [Bdellovibrionales bacterium GWB1_55_8]
MTKRYDQLVPRLQEIHDLRFAKAVLEWDQQTYMPEKGNEARSRQMALLASLAHEKQTSEQLGEWISALQAESSLSAEQKALVREAKRDRDKAVNVPASLVREISETAGKAHATWSEARKKNRFRDFAPSLKRLIELKTQEALARGVPGGRVPYDVLLDDFEPGATVEFLNPIISEARDISRAALEAIQGSRKKPKFAILQKIYPDAAQEKFGRFVMDHMGYDLAAGRLDRSVHPFTTSFDADDVRITTRYEERWLPSSLFGIIHECGHALYEQGLPRRHMGTPLGEAVSLGIHESQSRFWENQVGRSREFWQYFFPSAKKAFPKALGTTKLDDFHFAVNAVRPSLIRVEADEVTYNLHIVVRYELEQALFSGDLSVEDLPEAWNSKMKNYLGLKPKKDSEGVLQDVHWSFGGFGYFPTYLLGNLYASQWTATLRKSMPDFRKKISTGKLLPIKKWMNENIHQYGRLYPAHELAARISGEPLNPKHFDSYLKEKYGNLYQVSW